MSEHNVKVDISFRSLLEAVSLLDINDKRELWQLLEAELFPEEEYALEDTADSIATDKHYPELTAIQKRELDHRINNYEMNPENVLTWEEVRTSFTARF